MRYQREGIVKASYCGFRSIYIRPSFLTSLLFSSSSSLTSHTLISKRLQDTSSDSSNIELQRFVHTLYSSNLLIDFNCNASFSRLNKRLTTLLFVDLIILLLKNSTSLHHGHHTSREAENWRCPGRTLLSTTPSSPRSPSRAKSPPRHGSRRSHPAGQGPPQQSSRSWHRRVLWWDVVEHHGRAMGRSGPRGGGHIGEGEEEAAGG